MDAYADSTQHVLGELERIDLLVRVQVQFARQARGPQDEYQGLYISEEEVDRLLTAPAGMPRWATEQPAAGAPQVQQALAQIEAEIGKRKRESARRGVVLRLDELAARFSLSRFDVDALLVALAPEIDLRYERLYAYLQDDVTRKRPSVDLLLNLLSRSLADKLDHRRRFSPTSPLLQHELLHVFHDPSQPHPPLLAKVVKVDDRVLNYLFDSDEIDLRLRTHAELVRPESHLKDLFLPSELKQRLVRLVETKAGRAPILYFQGPYGVGKQHAAEAICQRMKVPLLVADGQRIAQLAETEFAASARCLAREAVLQNAALLWNGFDALLADDKLALRTRLLVELANRRQVTFLAGDVAWEPSDALNDVPFVRVEFPRPTFDERVQLWQASLNGDSPSQNDVDLASLANMFRLTGGQIRDAAATARNLARARRAGDARPSPDDLLAACRLQSNRKLATLAQKITPRYGWEDIVLPDDRMQQLREICNSVKYRSLVYDQWGFGGKLSLGKGLNVLFAGPSGTGKTMSAEIIAGQLGLELYKIDLSTVVSKYIGETEKNLSRIFTEAETSNAILFFDEADALFGKRSEVRDAHDRYANIEIGYLLQKMEEYEGIVILATNFRKNMDDAFVRRMHFTVEFPFPNERDRLRIWQKLWPDQTPRAADLDFDALARRYELAGGNIRNIALAAAFLAADQPGKVHMQHLLRATRREYQKMGKVAAESDFLESSQEIPNGS